MARSTTKKLREAKWKRDNRDKVAVYWRRQWLKKAYNLTIEQYDILLEAQNGRCAICRSLPEKDRRLAVDHNHETGRVRGLLCSKCNRGLGLFQDDARLLEEARRYAVDR